MNYSRYMTHSLILDLHEKKIRKKETHEGKRMKREEENKPMEKNNN